MSEIQRKKLLVRSRVEYADWSINLAEGCAHGCIYPCYAYLMKRRFGRVKNYEDWCQPKFVENACDLLVSEIRSKKRKIKNVFLSFATDPFMYRVPQSTELTLDILEELQLHDIPATILTKGILPFSWLKSMHPLNEYGITVVSLSEEFRERFEPNAAPIQMRIDALRELSKTRKTWVSMEPYPTPNIIDQDVKEILKEISFVDRIIFGRWNYSKFPDHGFKAARFYKDCIETIKSFCDSHGIEFLIKQETVNEINSIIPENWLP